MRQYRLETILLPPLIYGLTAYVGALQMGKGASFARLSGLMTFLTTIAATMTPSTKLPPGSISTTVTPGSTTVEKSASVTEEKTV